MLLQHYYCTVYVPAVRDSSFIQQTKRYLR